jgi:hypothetical protein
MVHDVDDTWVMRLDERFMNALVGKPVVAVFCGHQHGSWGLIDRLNLTMAAAYAPNLDTSHGHQIIPVFR